jgi:hypothetical protein
MIVARPGNARRGLPRPEGASDRRTLGSWPPAVDRQVKELSIFVDVAGLTAPGAV